MTESNIQVTKDTQAHQVSTAAQAPTHAAIAQRAYEIYAQHGHQKGHCKQNWQQAEKDLRHQAQTQCSTHACCDDKSTSQNKSASATNKTQ